MVIVIFTVLAIGIPFVFLAIASYLVYRIVVPIKRQLPKDLPIDLFDGKAASTATLEANQAATTEFKKSFGAKVRERISKMWCATSEFFFIQKRY